MAHRDDLPALATLHVRLLALAQDEAAADLLHRLGGTMTDDVALLTRFAAVRGAVLGRQVG